MDVKLIVTLTIEPLKPGRNINHIPHTYENTQWIDSDITQEDLDKFEIVHIPISDSGFPVGENANRLLEVAKKFVNKYSEQIGTYSTEKYPQSRAYFHCWGGQGRTCTAVIYISMKLYNENYVEACTRIRHRNADLNLSNSQIKFLNDLSLNGDDISTSIPIIRTPTDHECYLPTWHTYITYLEIDKKYEYLSDLNIDKFKIISNEDIIVGCLRFKSFETLKNIKQDKMNTFLTNILFKSNDNPLLSKMIKINSIDERDFTSGLCEFIYE
jgi:hypothetical protein